MSIVKDLKNAQTKIAALQSDIAEAIEARDNAAAETARVTAELTEKLTAHESTIDALKAEIAAATEEHAAAIAERDETLEALTGERDGIQAECAKLKRALADPAFAHAAATGDTPIEGAGEPGETKTKDQLLAEYDQIEDAQARAEFRKTHAVALGLSKS